MKLINWISQKRIFWFLLVGIVFLLTRGMALDRFVTTDETPWLMRSGNFYFALGQREFIKTDQGINPGITTMWVNTAAFLLEAPEYRGFGQGYFKHYIDFDRFVLSKNIDPHRILVTGRKLMLIENLVLFLVAFGFAIRLVGLFPSTAGFLLLALDPFHIALTRVSHMDGQLSSLMLVSVLAFLVYLWQGQKLIPLMVSAIAASLACLTKLPAYVLFSFFGLVLVVEVIIKRQLLKGIPGAFSNWAKKIAMHSLIYIGITGALYILLWPAMWVSPGKIFIDQVAGPFQFVAEDEAEVEDGLDEVASVEVISYDEVFRKLKYYPEWFLWQTTPVILAGMAASVITWIRKKGYFFDRSNRRLCWILLLFSILYITAITLVDKRNPRYMIPAYSMLVLLAGFGIPSAVIWIKEIKQKWIKLPLIGTITAAIMFFQIGAVATSFPYYFSYYNPLMGGGRKAGITRFVGSGEGLDQAARYLNTKEGAENLTAMSWYGSGCFSYYFDGATIIIPTGIGDDYIYENAGEADYLVIYNNQWLRQIPPELFIALVTIEPEKTIWINNIEYARIYPITALPPSYSQKIK